MNFIICMLRKITSSAMHPNSWPTLNHQLPSHGNLLLGMQGQDQEENKDKEMWPLIAKLIAPRYIIW